MKREGITKEKTHDIPWKLVKLNQCPEKQQVQGELILPSQVHKRYKGEWIHLPVRLVLYPKNDDTVHALTIMRDSTARNILHARLVTEGPSGLHAWVEPYSGNLEYYLRKTRLGMFRQKNTNSNTKSVLPTPILRSAVSQLVDGMDQIIASGNYHGNLSLVTTYYSLIDEQDPSTVEVKLCNFKEKKGTYKKKLAQDWRAVLAGLNCIREIANALIVFFPNIDCCQLDGLISFMRTITPSNAEVAFEEIKRQPFFWGKEERRLFFICEIPAALKKSQFISRVEKEGFIDLQWNKNDFISVLGVMNRYREAKGKKAYDTNRRVSFVKLVSAMYTHEPELKLWKKVDEIIQDQCPDLCYKLYVLLPGGKT